VPDFRVTDLNGLFQPIHRLANIGCRVLRAEPDFDGKQNLLLAEVDEEQPTAVFHGRISPNNFPDTLEERHNPPSATIATPTLKVQK
jgi:hypothetical protein